MHILFIGGTRFIGAAAARRLNELGHQVTVLHRGQSDGQLPAAVQHLVEPSVSLIGRDKLPDVRQMLADAQPDVVVDMLLMLERDAEITLNTLQGLTPRLVMISSGDVYRAYGRLIRSEPGDPVPVPATEDSPLREKLYPYRQEGNADKPNAWTNDYDKIPVEQRVMHTPGIQGTVLRLPMVYGPNDGQHRLFPYLKRMEDSRPAILLDSRLAGWATSRGYVENVAEAIALAATNERAAGRIYNVAEPQALPESEWVSRIAEAAGWHGRVVILTPEETPDSMRPEEDTRQDLTVDTSRIRQELGYREIVPPDEAMRRTVAWERANMPTHYPPDLFNYAAEDQALMLHMRSS